FCRTCEGLADGGKLGEEYAERMPELPRTHKPQPGSHPAVRSGAHPCFRRAPGVAPARDCETGHMDRPAPSAPHPITLDDVRGAHKMLSGVARMTAMESSRHLSSLVGAPVHLKCENLQRTGSFKIRGAYVRIHGLSESERARGVVAASAGNHAQGVALAASTLHISSTVFMPVQAPLPKLAATRASGAEVHRHGSAIGERLAEGTAYAVRTGAVFIHPFDHPDVIAGQGTVGLELLDQLPGVATVIVAAGGGGLAGGVAAAIKAVRPDTTVIGVQAE